MGGRTRRCANQGCGLAGVRSAGAAVSRPYRQADLVPVAMRKAWSGLTRKGSSFKQRIVGTFPARAEGAPTLTRRFRSPDIVSGKAMAYHLVQHWLLARTEPGLLGVHKQVIHPYVPRPLGATLLPGGPIQRSGPGQRCGAASLPPSSAPATRVNAAAADWRMFHEAAASSRCAGRALLAADRQQKGVVLRQRRWLLHRRMFW